MNFQTQIYKGILEICILQYISKGTNYGYDIVSKLNNSNLEVAVGTVYTILSRIKEDGLVETKYEYEEGSVPRKIYTITPKGMEKLVESRAAWETISRKINTILN